MFRSMDEFRHRSFAQVCRAEANVSLSAPRRIKRPRDGIRSEKDRKEARRGMREGVAGREVERVWHDARSIAYEPSSTLSDRSFSPSRQSLRTLASSPSRKRYASCQVSAIITIRHIYIQSLPRYSSRLRLRDRRMSCVYVNKREKILKNEFDQPIYSIIPNEWHM